MGQVLGFAHCKEAPSTASTTPDSTEGGPEDPPPFPEPPEDEDDDDDDDDDDEENEEGAALRCRPSPHELTSPTSPSGGEGVRGAPARSPPEPRPRPLPPLPTNHRPPRALTDRRGSCCCGASRGRSALAQLAALLLLGSLSRFSAVAVLAHAALAVLAVTVPLRLRRLALSALRPPGTEPPDSVNPVPPPVPPPVSPRVTPARAQPWSLSEEQQQRWARFLARHAAAAGPDAHRLFLVHSVPESLKFAFLFYLLTYVGAAVNGVTLLAAGVISAFTFPVLYRRHQAQIDQYLSLARGHLSHLRARVLAKLPSAKVKPQ
ncbi:LOW QUALITY PROTEIN: reticulon-1-A-like [Ammospiza maritima maritima]